jgi:hypothetical protein
MTGLTDSAAPAALAAADVSALLVGLAGLRRAVEVAAVAAAQHALGTPPTGPGESGRHDADAAWVCAIVARVHARPWW